MQPRHYYYYTLDSGRNVQCSYRRERISVDPYTNIGGYKTYDNLLHQTLHKILQEHNSLTSRQIKEFLNDSDQYSIIQLILKKKPTLSRIFPRRKMQSISVLWVAVLEYCQNSVELLVRLGADVNVRTSNGKTILHLLVKLYPSSWNERIIVMVLNKGADVHARDRKGDTPLHSAAYVGRVQVIKLLLEKGADINAANNKGITPLLIAAYVAEADELVPFLIERGADVMHRDKEGHNALHMLTRVPGKHVEVVRTLIEKGVSLDDRASQKYRPIHLAVVRKNNELVKLFLDHGSDVNARAEDDESPLHLAAKHKESTILLTLLKRGANIDLKIRSKGHTPLHVACLNQSVENFKLLVSVGADMFVEDVDSKTPLALVSHGEMGNLNASSQMLITLALKKVSCLQPSIEWKDEKMIQQDYPKVWDCYRVCIAEAKKMKFTKFIETCSFLELVTKCQCQIAELMRNPEFSTLFCMFDLKALFPVYKEEVIEAFERAEYYHYSVLQQENLIDKAVYNILPYMVVRKIARYALNCEVCEMKRIVHASRQSAPQEQ